MTKKPAGLRRQTAAERFCALADGLLELYSASGVVGFQDTAVRVLRRLVPCTFASSHEVGGGSRVVRHVCQPRRYAGTSNRLRVRDRNANSGSGAKRAIVPRAVYDPRGASGGLDDALVLTIEPAPSTRLIFTVARIGESFSERERITWELLRPHLLRACELVVFLAERRPSAAGEADPSAASALLRRRFGLTDRESELLYWLARGKSNRDMGTIFGISGRTVDKHLQHVFDKMDVENRHAAIVQALHAIGPG